MQRKNFFSFLTPNSQPVSKLNKVNQMDLVNTPPPSYPEVSVKIARLSQAHYVYDHAVRINPIYHQKKEEAIARFKSKKNGTIVYYPIIFDAEISANSIEIADAIIMDLGYRFNETITIQVLTEVDFDMVGLDELYLTLEVVSPADSITVNTDDLEQYLRDQLLGKIISPATLLITPYLVNAKTYAITSRINEIKQGESSNVAHCLYYLKADSQINFKAIDDKKISLLVEGSLQPLSLDFKAKGIGGHKKQLTQFLREGFYARLLPNQYAELYDIKPCKGILLYGPPGTGKTAIARAIASTFSKDKVKIVNGPELKDRFVGQSEANLRNVFYEADIDWVLKGKKSDLHVLIFDEIDALCPARGTRTGSTGVDDNMVSQFLTILDGVESAQNILVIGMTNRKELLDPALLRPGRLDVHIEIGLPDEEGRLEILEIKTKKMREKKLLDQQVNLVYWAKQTQNYTGAEIEQLIRKAQHYAIGHNFEVNERNELMMKRSIKNPEHLQKIKLEHFERAFLEITPAFGFDKKLQQLHSQEFTIYPQLQKIIDVSSHIIKTVLSHPHLNNTNLLLSGESGTGKTALAMYLAQIAGCKYVKMITAQMFLGLSLEKHLAVLEETFVNAKRSTESIIILDEFENLLEADVDFSHYSNILRLKYVALLKEMMNEKNKSLIIVTAKSKDFIRRLNMLNLFHHSEELQAVKLDIHAEMTSTLLTQFALKMDVKFFSDKKKIAGDETIVLPIRDLIYQVKRFCASKQPTKTLNTMAFYQYLQEEVQPNQDLQTYNRFFKRN